MHYTSFPPHDNLLSNRKRENCIVEKGKLLLYFLSEELIPQCRLQVESYLRKWFILLPPRLELDTQRNCSWFHEELDCAGRTGWQVVGNCRMWRPIASMPLGNHGLRNRPRHMQALPESAELTGKSQGYWQVRRHSKTGSLQRKGPIYMNDLLIKLYFRFRIIAEMCKGLLN